MAEVNAHEDAQRRKWLAALSNPEEAQREHLAAMRYDPKGVAIRFFMKPQIDVDKSIVENRPIFVEKEFVEIQIPGNKDEIRVREVRWYDKEHHPVEYAAFKARGETAVIGTPLDHLPSIGEAQKAELRYYGVKTVEQLAGLPDGEAQKFFGIQEARRKAREFMEGKAPSVTGLEAEVAALREQLAALAAKPTGGKPPKG